MRQLSMRYAGAALKQDTTSWAAAAVTQATATATAAAEQLLGQRQWQQQAKS